MSSLYVLYGISWKSLTIAGYHDRFYTPNWLKMKICAWVLWIVLCCCDQNLVPSLVVADRGKGHANFNPESETVLNKPDISASVDSKEKTLAEKQSRSTASVVDGSQPVDKVSKAASKTQYSLKPKTKLAAITVSNVAASVEKSATDTKPVVNITSSAAVFSSQLVDGDSSQGTSISQSDTSNVLHHSADHVVSSLHIALDDLQAPIAQDKDAEEDEKMSTGLPDAPVESVRAYRVHEAKVVVATKEGEVQDSVLPPDHPSAASVIDTSNNGTASSDNPAPVGTDEGAGGEIPDEGLPQSTEEEISSDSSSEGVPDAGTPATLEPYNEWVGRRRAEQKKIDNVPATTSSQGKTQSAAKLRQKNYALADCGAKIIGTNPEAQNPSAVLNNYKDEYMLNPCTAKIWLVIELCEPIQASKLELANFELFSSSPRAFSVFSSDRYPSREWVSLGKFEALDEKTLQSFDLEPPVEQHFFYKFIKVEMASHYGSEHYCPVSMVRVYGTSELEVLETDENQDSAENQEDDDGIAEEGFFGTSTSSKQNLIESAKGVVLNIVNKVLSRDPQPAGADLESAVMDNATEEAESFGSQAHTLSSDQCLTVLRPCSGWNLDLKLGNASDSVVQFLSCNYHSIASLLELPTVRYAVQQCSCDYVESDSDTCKSSSLCQYLHACLGPVRFSAVCYVHKLNLDAARVGKAIYYPNCTGPPLLLPATGVPVSEVSSPVTEVHVTVSPLSQVADLDSADERKVDIPISVLPTPKPTLELTIKVSDADDLSTLQQTPRTLPVSQSIKEKIQPTRTLHEADVALNKGRDEVKSGSSASELSEQLSVASKDSGDEQIPAASVEHPAASESEKVSAVEDASVPIRGSLTPEVQQESSSAASGEAQDVGLSAASELAKAASAGIDSKPAEGNGVNPDPNLCGEILSNGDAAFTDMSDLGMVPSAQTLSAPSSSSSTTSGVNRTSGPTGTQKESVFVRLSNRIKALEVNMSLSGQYLEELSQRYRKQMEEMQRAFNKTIGALNDTAKKAYERDMKQQEIITVLQTQIDNLSNTLVSIVNERDSSGFKVFERHFVLIFVELVIAACVFVMLKRRRTGAYTPSVPATVAASGSTVYGEPAYEVETLEAKTMKRRNSFTGAVGHTEHSALTKRRPSEEALNISGTYEELMIVEPLVPIMVEPPDQKAGEVKRKKQRNRKGSREFVRSASNLVLGSQGCRPVKKISNTKVTSAGLLFGRDASDQIEQEVRNRPNTTHRHSSHPSAKPPRSPLPANGIKTGLANGKPQHLCSRNGGSIFSDVTSVSSVSSKHTSNGIVCNGNIHKEETKKEGFTLRKFIQKLYTSR